MVEKKYNVFMDGEIIDRSVTMEKAEELIDEYIEADEDDGEDHYYMIKPV